MQSNGDGVSLDRKSSKKARTSVKASLNCFVKDELSRDSAEVSRLLVSQFAHMNPEVESDQVKAYLNKAPKLQEQWQWPTGLALNEAYTGFIQRNIEPETDVRSKNDAKIVSDFLPLMVSSLKTEVKNRR